MRNETAVACTVTNGVLTFDAANVTFASGGSLSVTSDTVTIPCGSTVAAGTQITSVTATGTITIQSGVSLTGPYQDTSGVAVRFTGLPANHSGVVACWPQSQGTSTRTNLISGSVADTSATSVTLTLAADTAYYYVMDALGYRRSAVNSLDTTTQREVTGSLEAIVDAQGTELIPDTLTQAETDQAALVTWASDFITVDADGTHDEISYNALVYAVEQGQSTASAQGSLLHPARIEVGRVVFPTSSTQKWRAKATLTDTTKVPDLQSTGIYKDGSSDAEDFIDFSNGPLKYKAEAPVFATVEGTSEELIHDYLDSYSNKDDYKGIPDQTVFNTRMDDVTSTIKATYHGTGGGGGGGSTDVVTPLGASVFGSDFQGTWSAGVFAIGDVVYHGSQFYQCTVARDSTHTDNPATDTASWAVTGLSALLEVITTYTDILDDTTHGLAALRTLVAALPTSTLSSSDVATTVNTATIGTNVAAIKTAVEHASSGLSALKSLIDTVDTVVDANKASIESTSSGLGAIKTVVDTIVGHTDILDDASSGLAALQTAVSAIPTTNPSATDVVTAFQSADFGEADGDQTLQSVLASMITSLTSITTSLTSITTSIAAIPTTNASAADVVTALQQADFGSEANTQTLQSILASIVTALAAIPTSNPSATEMVTALLAADVGGAVGTQTLQSVLTALQTSINALPTTTLSAADVTGAVPTASQIATAVNAPSTTEIASAIAAMDVGSADGTQTLQSVLASLHTAVTDNTAILEHTTYGLEALRSLMITLDTIVDENKASLTHADHGLAALRTLITAMDTVVDANKATLEHTTHGLAALQTLVGALPTTAPPSADTIADAVQDLEIVSGLNLVKALQLLVSIGGGRIINSGSTFDVYSLIDNNRIAVIPKFSGESRSAGASLIVTTESPGGS